MDINNILIIDTGKESEWDHIIQIISKARKVSDILNYKVNVLCAQKRKDQDYRKMIDYGADLILKGNIDRNLDYFEYSKAVEKVLNEIPAKVVFFPATELGKAIAGVISTRFDAGLTADCIDIEISDEKCFLFVRAAMNNHVVAKIKCINCSLGLATIKKDVFKMCKRKSLVNGEIRDVVFDITDKLGEYEVLHSYVREEKNKVNLSRYSVVFCIGRGVRNDKTREKIVSLAENYGAGVIGTRAAVDDGIIGKERQVGQSGKSISPKIYVGFGVSGATQHIVGIKDVDILIAINNDKHAAIFNYADYPILEDVNDFVDEMHSIIK